MNKLYILHNKYLFSNIILFHLNVFSSLVNINHLD